MATSLLTARSNRPGSSEVVLVDGAVATGYTLLQPDWGNAAWEPFFSGSRGTQGARSAGAEPQNRNVRIPLGIQAGSTNIMHAALSVLWGLDEEMRRFGGTITWRPAGATYKQYFDVLSCSAQVANWDWVYHNLHYVIAELAPVCAPYLRGDPYDIFDGFDTNTIADYTIDAAGGGAKVAGGQMVPLGTGLLRWRHTGRGYTYGDVQATVKITTGSTVVGYEADLMICADTAGADTHLSAQLFGGNLRLIRFSAGSQAVIASTAFAISTATTYWLRIRREGRLLTANAYTSEGTPISLGTTLTASLNLADNTNYAAGHTGLRLNVVSTAERYDDFRVEPFTYTSGVSFG